MRAFIPALLSLLVLGAFFAPMALPFGMGSEIALAQSENVVNPNLPTDDSSNGFLGEKELTRGLQAFGGLLITLGAWVLNIGSALFNFGIEYSILEFAKFANVQGIAVAWQVLRDVSNTFFIFIFLAIGIGTILGLQQFGIRRLLPSLLIIAVLINFSLFFSKAIIDVAHGFAAAILTQSGTIEAQCESGDCRIEGGVGAAFIQQLGVVSFFGGDAQETISGGEENRNPIWNGERLSDGIRALIFGFFGFVFLSAAGIIFLAGAVILIMRIVKLLLLLIASAPAFASYVLPNTRGNFNKWLGELVKEAFFAPILLLLISISLLFLNTARGAFGVDNDQAGIAAMFLEGDVGGANALVIFLVALGFLFMSIKVAQDLGVSGAKQALKVQNWGTRQLSKAGAGSTAFALRNTVGRGGANVATNIRSSKFGRSSLGRLTAQTFDKVGDASYDPRALAPKGMKDAVGKAGKGYTSRIKDRAKEEQKYAKDLGLTREERGIKKSTEKDFDTKIRDKEAAIATATDPANKKLLEAELKKLKDDKEKSIKAIDQAPQRQYAENLEREVVSKTKQFELTEDGQRVEREFDQKRKEIDELRTKIRNEKDAITRHDLTMELNALQRELNAVAVERQKLKLSGNYQARTGDYITDGNTAFPTEAEGKFAGARAIRKELDKDASKKNLDTLVDALKGEGGKKDDKEDE